MGDEIHERNWREKKLSENLTLKEFVRNHWVKKVPQYEETDLSNDEAEVNLYKKAGFTQIAKIKEQSISLQKEKNEQN